MKADEDTASSDVVTTRRAGKPSPAAQRALDEAAARRKTTVETPQPTELDGRGGLDPSRYGDWEVKGLASDFS